MKKETEKIPVVDIIKVSLKQQLGDKYPSEEVVDKIIIETSKTILEELDKRVDMFEKGTVKETTEELEKLI